MKIPLKFPNGKRRHRPYFCGIFSKKHSEFKVFVQESMQFIEHFQLNQHHNYSREYIRFIVVKFHRNIHKRKTFKDVF